MKSRKFTCLLLFLLFGITTVLGNSFFWHVTDMHYDPTYGDTQDSCNDVIGNPGKYGDYECDSPHTLVRSAVRAMKYQGGLPAFIVYIGDTPFHPKDAVASNFSTAYMIDMIENITAIFDEFFPGVKVVMAIGNHDFYPIGQVPGSTNEMYDQLAELWSPWLTPNAVDTVRAGGYYTMLINDTVPSFKLRVVVLNTNLYLVENNATKGETDPAGQLAWLEQVLSNARQQHEKVHIITHVPNGVMPAPDMPMWMRNEQNSRLNTIISDYGDIIMGCHSSHEHLDSFRIFYKDGKPATTLFVAPSVTPWRARLADNQRGPAHDPGIRKVFFDDIDGYLTDIHQYHLHLLRANTNEEDVWTVLYRFNAIYDVDNLTAPAIHELTERFKLYANNEFHAYYDMSTVGAVHSSIEPCSCDCKFRHICAMQHVDYAAFQACLEVDACGGNALKVSVVLLFVAAMLPIGF